MADDHLDLQGIDALLDRFRARKKVQESLASKTSEWEVDQPGVLRDEALEALDLRFRLIADRVSGDISAVLRAHVKVTLSELRQYRFRSIVDSMPQRIVGARLTVAELSLPAFVITTLETGTSMIDLLVGGSGETAKVVRDLTLIEERVLRLVVDPFVQAHGEMLTRVTPITLSWAETVGTPTALHALPPTELFLVARYRIEVDSSLTWDVDFLLPLSEILSAIESAAQLPVQTVEAEEDRRTKVKRTLSQVAVDSTIEVGSSELTLREVTQLAPGDVVVLDRTSTDLLEMKIEGRRKYRGTLGRAGRSMAFKVVEVV